MPAGEVSKAEPTVLVSPTPSCAGVDERAQECGATNTARPQSCCAGLVCGEGASVRCAHPKETVSTEPTTSPTDDVSYVEKEDGQGPKCITSTGDEGTCIDVSKCNGTFVPWSSGDPEPNCFMYPKGTECCIEEPVASEDKVEGNMCITSTGDEGTCIDVSRCTGTFVSWSPGDPEPNCFLYPKGIECCIEEPKAAENKVEGPNKSLGPKCITSTGDEGTCIDITHCTGTSVPWSPGDPEPNCFVYHKSIQCCIEEPKSVQNKVNDSQAIVVVEDIPKAPCSLGEDVVVCSSSDRDCNSFFIDSCYVYCQDENACKDTDINASTVECVGERSCYGASFHQSDITCSKQEWYTCRDAEFFASAVTCEDGYYTCDEDMFYSCSCCKSLRLTVMQSPVLIE